MARTPTPPKDLDLENCKRPNEKEIIPGVYKITGPMAELDRGGILALPPEFNKKKYAAKWQFEGQRAARDQQSEWITEAGVRADGWQIWKNAEGKPEIRALRNGNVVLMFRPIEIQDELKKVYGGISRARLTREIKGETVTQPEHDTSGLLPASMLPKEPDDLETGPMPAAVFGDPSEAGVMNIH